MASYFYKKSKKPLFRKKSLRIVSILVFLGGIATLLYVLFPLLSWQFYFAPVFAVQDVAAPIPKTTIVSSSSLSSLLSGAAQSISGIDYTNAQNWFSVSRLPKGTPPVPSYVISLPSLKISRALVSTMDNDLGIHLVHYSGTTLPPENGTAVIFGHSTLPQLFNEKDYKTIFANAYKLKIGDEIIVDISGVIYTYRIFATTVVDPTDESVFEQHADDAYLTLVTCTPPGTTWKRLLIKSRLEKI